MGQKTLGLLREVVRSTNRVATLLNPANPFSAPTLKQAQIAAEMMHAELLPRECIFDDGLKARDGPDCRK